MQHHFILRYLRRPNHHDHRHYHPFTTTTSVIPSITWVRDRALDHAVEKERDLKPITNLKNLIISEPSKSLPLSIITNNKTSLSIPNRPIDFIRKYPSLFHEYFPAGININIHPHVKLTPEILTLDAEEQVLFGSDVYKQDVANRLLKLLMLGRVNRIPLSVIDRFKWDLGLPNDYVESVVPHFPHYFRVVSNSNSNSNSNDMELELVCWNDELAVSVMEAKGTSEFKVQYSRGFELDKKFKKWVDEWQKLPYVSPYENVMSLGAKSEGSDKWVVGLMHEVLNILVPKKTEKDNLLVLGEYLGVRSRFKKALLEHPGIFYVSSKLRTHTVVLREGYKRDLLVEKVRHPAMKLRGSYIHLMNVVKEKSKAKDAEVGEKKQKSTRDLDGEDDDVSDEEEDDDDVSDEEEEEDETEGVIDGESEDLEETQRTPTKRRKFEGRKLSDQRSMTRRSDGSDESEDLEEMRRTPTKKTNLEGRKNPDQRSRVRRSDDNDESEDLDNGYTKIRGRTNSTGRFNDSNRRNTPNSRGNVNDGRRGRRNDRKYASDERSDFRTNRMSDGRVAKETNSTTVRVNDNDGRRGRGNDRKYASDERSDFRTNRMSDRRGNDNVGRRGRGDDRKYAFDERSDSRTNRLSDRRGAKDTNPPRFLRTEAPGARASRGRSSERPGFSRTREGGSSAKTSVPRTREGRPSERSGVPRTREGRPSERSRVSRTREGRF